MLLNAADQGLAKCAPDPVQLRLVVQAFAARDHVVHCKPQPMVENYSKRYMSRLVRLSYLAPNIISAIINGTQPADGTTALLYYAASSAKCSDDGHMLAAAEKAAHSFPMQHERPPRKFEDLEIGETRKSSTISITAEEIVEFARQHDPQWFHVDPDAANKSHFGEVVASGVQVLAIWRRLDHEIKGDIDFVCGVGFDEFRLKSALRPGDRVFATSRITDLTPSQSGKARGTAII